MTPGEKTQKTALKALYKKMLQAHAHIVILQDDAGAFKMYTNMNEVRDISYIMTYMANDLLGKAEDFDAQMQEAVKKKIKEKADQEIDEMAAEFETKNEEK